MPPTGGPANTFRAHVPSRYWHLTPKGTVKPCKNRRTCPYPDQPHTEASIDREAEKIFRNEREQATIGVVNVMSLGWARDQNGILGARDVADWSRSRERANGVPSDMVDIRGKIQISDEQPPISLRRVTTTSGSEVFVEWELSRELPDGRLYQFQAPITHDLINTKLETFFLGSPRKERSAPVPPFEVPGLTQKETHEAYKELMHRIREITRAVEHEVELSPLRHINAHPVGDLCHYDKDAHVNAEPKLTPLCRPKIDPLRAV